MHKLLELVDQSDIDAAVDVFKQLGHLGNRGAADGHNAAEDGAVHRRGQFRGRRAATAHYLGNIVARHSLIAWILALRRKDDMDAALARGARNFQAVRVAGFEQAAPQLLPLCRDRWCFQAQSTGSHERKERWTRPFRQRS